MEALTLQGNGGSGGGGGPQRMIDEEESTVDVEEKRKGRVVKEAQPPWIKLGLGTAADSATTAQNPVTEHRKPVVLTPAQLHELQGQALIYKHLEAGLPVPLHLLIPIWKSVASCFGPSIYKLYPSFIGCFSPQGFDYRTMMDPEPGRCRRTDGKKWRCSKNAIPDQKYCERHMHRGRQRSRKPVEAFGSPSGPGSMPLDKSNNKLGELSRNHANSVPVGLQLMTPTSSNTPSNHNSSTTTTTTSWSNMGSKRYVSSETITTRHPYPSISAATTTLPTTASMPPIATLETVSTFNPNPIDKIEDNSERKDISSNHMVYTTCLKSSSNKVVSLGLGFSPKSVLQVQACNSSCTGNQSGFELEPGRCRRTDGKKWRCSRDVVPDRKYCTQHMHRGAKKRTIASQTISVPAPPTSASHRASPYRISIHREADLPFPNTDLSISIQASPQLMHDDGKSPTSSSSDTTITDTSITANVYGYVSS